MTRAEHLQWAKDRAVHELEFYEAEGNPDACRNAVVSMMSDLGKHDELRGHSAIRLGGMLLLGGHLGTSVKVRDWVKGFN